MVGEGFQFRSDNVPNFLKNFNRLRNVNDVILIKINVSLIIEMNNRDRGHVQSACPPVHRMTLALS